MKLIKSFISVGLAVVVGFSLAFFAQQGADISGAGKLTFEKDILPLFKKDGAFYEDSESCVSCHRSVEKGYHELSMKSYEGILIGADTVEKAPGVSILGQPKAGPITADNPVDWDNSKLKARLRNTRMPPGWEWDEEEGNRDTPAIKAIQKWVQDGATEEGYGAFLPKPLGYGKRKALTVGELFTVKGVFFPRAQSCKKCHQSVEKGYHELNMKTYEGIVTGADTVEKAPGVSILGQPKAGPITADNPVNWDKSKLKARLRNTRMPPGWDWDIEEANRDTPEINLIKKWVKAGAPNGAF